MFETKLLRGVLFNKIRALLLEAINGATSESDLMVKLARKVKKDPSITHDHQVFRKFRKGINTTEDVVEYLSLSLPANYPNVNDYDNNSLGEWFVVKGIIFSLSQNFTDSKPLNDFWRYLDAHCDLEYRLILDSKTKVGESILQEYIRSWLLVEDFAFEAENRDKIASYMIRLVMYWAANLELYLTLEYGGGEHSILSSILPSTYVKAQNNYFSPSSEKLLNRLNVHWAKTQYQKDKISNQVLFRDILKKQFEDPDIDTSKTFQSALDKVTPNTAAIKKRFERWGHGELFTLKHFRQDVAILTRSYAYSDKDITVALPYVVANLFTLMQIKLIGAGINPELIVIEFADYPTYEVLAKKRYDEFVLSGELLP